MANLTLNVAPNLTKTQRNVLRSSKKFQLLTGLAGTGKTYVAIVKALRLLDKDPNVKQLIIVRSAVETRKIGFLPGDQAEKLEVYAAPYVGLLSEVSPKKNYKQLVANKQLDFISTSFLRGITFRDCVVIIDEYQNMSAHELETAVTRVSETAHLFLCGDSDQTDLPSWESKDHRSVIETLTSMTDDFDVHTFGLDDIVRSGFIRRYYEAKQPGQQQDAKNLPAFIQKGLTGLVE
jgi:phosphate starvation-inducible protein PhoH